MHNFSPQVEEVVAGTPETIAAEYFIGAKLIGGSAASTVVIHAGDDAAEPIIAAAACAATEADHTHNSPLRLDQGLGGNPHQSIHVVVTGTGAYAIVEYAGPS